MATTVTLAVEALRTIESRGPCRGTPRISTVARGKAHGRPRKCHGRCHGPPPQGQIMCIRACLAYRRALLWSLGGRRLRWLVGELCCDILWRRRRHRCGLPQKTHDRASSIGAGSSSHQHRRRVLQTTMGHEFARPLHSSTSMMLVSI